MNCDDVKNVLETYADDELDNVRALDVEKHLEACSACSEILKNHQNMKELLHDQSLAYEAPPSLENRLRALIRNENKTRTFIFPWRWMGLAASLIFVVLSSFSLWRLASTPSFNERVAQEVVSSHIRSLMANHLQDVASTDQHTVKPWFNGKLSFSPWVTDLSPQGFPLVGGRLDYLNDRPVAALVYQRQKHFINLFTWPSSLPDNTEVKTTTLRGYHVFHWTQSGMNYWAVSDLNPAELKEFVNQVGK